MTDMQIMKIVFTGILVFGAIGVLLLDPRKNHNPPAWLVDGLSRLYLRRSDGRIRLHTKLFIVAVTVAGIVAMWIFIPNDAPV